MKIQSLEYLENRQLLYTALLDGQTADPADDGAISDACQDSLTSQLLTCEIVSGIASVFALPLGIATGTFLFMGVIEKLTKTVVTCPNPWVIGGGVLGGLIIGPTMDAGVTAMIASQQSSNVWIVGDPGIVGVETNYEYPAQCNGENDEVFHYLFNEAFVIGLYTYAGTFFLLSGCLGVIFLNKLYKSHVESSHSIADLSKPYQTV